jgi:DNA polymerase-3 subunit delta'
VKLSAALPQYFENSSVPVTNEDLAIAARIEPEKYFWHDTRWAALTRDLTRLPHALLLHGQAGLGKNAFALRLARFLFCPEHTDDKQACGACQSCMLFRAGNHPDLMRVGPQEDSSNILVDQVRGIVEFLSLKPHMAAHKIVIISPAEAMNVNAANSLLKILEEPPAGCLLILVATHLSRVSVTIRSRCMRMACSAPPLSEALAWLRSQPVKPNQVEALLALAGGAPLTALTFADEGYADNQARFLGDLAALAQGRDLVVCAERWKVLGTESCLAWLHRFMVSAIRSQASSLPQGFVAIQFLSIGKSFSLSIIDLFKFIDKISIARRQLGTGVDETLMLEELLIHWCEMTSIAV